MKIWYDSRSEDGGLECMRKYLNNIGFLSGITLLIMVVSLFGMSVESAEQIAEEKPTKPVEDLYKEPELEVEVEEEVEEEEAIEEVYPDPINGLMIGFDRSRLLTDVMMVGHIDPKNNQVQIISIPRDLEIFFTDDEFKAIKEQNDKNRILHAKINNIYYLLGGDEQALQDIKSIAEQITGLKIDYMMTIDITGFRDVVDAVGGVEFYVPQDMKYSDPVQDLYIDLEEGLQVLDGDKAEQLVRFRKGYEKGDLQRIEVQQDFVAALMDQVTTQRNFDQITDLLNAAYNMVDTDFGMVVVLEYAEFFFKLNLEHVLTEDNMITIPSWGEKVEGMWFQYFDIDEAHNVVQELINNEEAKDGQ